MMEILIRTQNAMNIVQEMLTDGVVSEVITIILPNVQKFVGMVD